MVGPISRILPCIFLLLLGCQAEEKPAERPFETPVRSAKGSLFIIGGGARPDAMMKNLVEQSLNADQSYAVIFTQASSEPDSAFFYLHKQMVAFTDRPILHIDSLRLSLFPLDSIRKAGLIFISGGDQNRFMNAVSAEAKAAITQAYADGATIAGTSAGAALMSKIMITGDQNLEADYESTYSHLKYGNGIYAQGLGLVDSLIIDQHFVRRSRYNRLISALADTEYPIAVGIEEATALQISPMAATVVGEGQVIVIERPEKFGRFNDQIGFKNTLIHAYLPGDTVYLNSLK